MYASCQCISDALCLWNHSFIWHGLKQYLEPPTQHATIYGSSWAWPVPFLHNSCYEALGCTSDSEPKCLHGYAPSSLCACVCLSMWFLCCRQCSSGTVHTIKSFDTLEFVLSVKSNFLYGCHATNSCNSGTSFPTRLFLVVFTCCGVSMLPEKYSQSVFTTPAVAILASFLSFLPNLPRLWYWVPYVPVILHILEHKTTTLPS